MNKLQMTKTKCRLPSSKRSGNCKTKEIDLTLWYRVCIHKMLRICSRSKTLATVGAVNWCKKCKRYKSKKAHAPSPFLWAS